MPAAMIITHTTPVAGGFQIELHYPNVKKPVVATVDSPAQAKRLEYFHERRYIHDKLSRWLRQRLYTLEQGDRRRITPEAAKLKVELGQYGDASLAALCGLISRHAGSIAGIAPGPHSAYHDHYRREIMPLVQYCQTFKTE